jgi:hypothetical protein
VRFAESDFHLNAEGRLIATHGEQMGGSCGRVDEATTEQLRDCTLANGDRVATLADFLEVPLDEWFLDLKDTLSGNDSAVLRAINAAIAEVEHYGVQERAVLMTYRVSDAVVARVHEAGVRAGVKGYPAQDAAVMAMVEQAAAAQFELVCVEIDSLSERILQDSAKLGVWHLAWDTSSRPELWRRLSRAGLGGVITPDVQCAERAAAPVWRPAE